MNLPLTATPPSAADIGADTAADTAAQMQALGQQAKAASSAMAKAPVAVKNAALKCLAALLRASTEALQTANAHDLDRARAAGLSGPMLGGHA